jgi:hypothetical protein
VKKYLVNFWMAISVGFFSGIVAYGMYLYRVPLRYLFDTPFAIVDELLYFGGVAIVFGVISGIYFSIFSHNDIFSKIVRIVGWVGVSTISLYLAITIEWGSKGLFPSPGDFFISGFVGALVLIIGFSLLYKTFSAKLYVLLLLICSLTPPILSILSSQFSHYFYFFLFVLWQTVVVVTLSRLLINDKRLVDVIQ